MIVYQCTVSRVIKIDERLDLGEHDRDFALPDDIDVSEVYRPWSDRALELRANLVILVGWKDVVEKSVVGAVVFRLVDGETVNESELIVMEQDEEITCVVGLPICCLP
jgi:hypothetical protein